MQIARPQATLSEARYDAVVAAPVDRERDASPPASPTASPAATR